MKGVVQDVRREPAGREVRRGEAARGSRTVGRIARGPARIDMAGIDSPAASRREGQDRRLAACVIGGQPAAANRSRVEGAGRAGLENAWPGPARS
jgi:hypothetical protein